MSRSDHLPAQAEAEMARLQAEARKADLAREEAIERAEEIERDIDATVQGKDEARLESLQNRLQEAEVEIENRTRDFESFIDQISNSTHFWYEEDAD